MRLTYFDDLARGNFKHDAAGRTVFFPLGVFGKGRVLPDAATEHRLRDRLVTQYQLAIVVAIALGVLHNLLLMLVVGLGVVAWMSLRSLLLVAAYPPSDLRLSWKERYASPPSSGNVGTQWFLLVCCVALVAGGLLLLVVGDTLDERVAGFVAAVFFGAVGLARAYGLRTKRAA
ncbi:hypothetical protein CKO44_05395 [Rubrivivax gelatinosus]|uniref:hypothetical protein n=1 Tax=Rubrivivax gelatinosus TaxID=28068 RepID=UPI0019083815|nr:hypothetical protein [Rubrivivax gelatinosus]MBK1612904.1 hypothetical protein [Rubrivivax gelatinosus]MBZ8143238.1 hypothetical protein [Rubrivivax gelatinosus]